MALTGLSCENSRLTLQLLHIPKIPELTGEVIWWYMKSFSNEACENEKVECDYGFLQN